MHSHLGIQEWPLCPGAALFGKRFSSDTAGDGPRVDAHKEELDLLFEGVTGAKTYKQVRRDALKPSCPCKLLQRAVRTNASRGIRERLIDVTGISKESLHYSDVRCKPGANGDSNTKQHPFNLISNMIGNIHARDGHFFEHAHVDPQPGVAASSFTNSPEYLNHPLVRECSGTGVSVFPICIYSDGVKVCCDSHPDSLYGIYVTFIHRDMDECTELRSKHLFTCYRKEEIGKEGVDDILAVLLWDLQAVAQGRKPVAGEEVKPHAEQQLGEHIHDSWGRWNKFCVMQMKGDWAYYTEVLGLPQWNCKGHMCPFCNAKRDGPYTWYNFSLEAPWLFTCRSHERFLQDLAASAQTNFRPGRCAFKFRSKLVDIPYFQWTIVKADFMHAADLGILPHALGELFWSLLRRLSMQDGGAASRDKGFIVLKRRIKEYYHRTKPDSKLPMKRFTINKIKSGRRPARLKAKAGVAKRLLPFALELAQEFREDDGDMGEYRYQCVRHLADIYDLARKRELTEAEVDNWRWSAAMHMFYYVMCDWHVVPKHHYFLHLPEQILQSGVPRSFWVYSDESKNFQLKFLFNKASKGSDVCWQIILRLEQRFILEELLHEYS